MRIVPYPVFHSKESEKILNNIAKINDAIYIIAPETGKTLQSLVEVAEQTGKISLNCESQAIGRVADKAFLYETLDKLEVIPRTVVLDLDEGLVKAKQTIEREIGYPFVLKPVDGVSCAGLSLVKRRIPTRECICKNKR